MHTLLFHGHEWALEKVAHILLYVCIKDSGRLVYDAIDRYNNTVQWWDSGKSDAIKVLLGGSVRLIRLTGRVYTLFHLQSQDTRVDAIRGLP